MASADLTNPAPGTPARRSRVWVTSHPVAVAFIVAVAALVVIPLVNLVRIALTGDAEFWRDNAAYVLPVAIQETVLLLAGVAFFTAVIGTGTAWLVTAFRFPGRGAFAWLLPLPLAIPTYIVAYIYVDICDALGPVQTIVRALSGGHVSWYPDVRSLPGAIFVFSLVLYPYVFLAARAMFQTQSASLFEAARTLGATRLMLARHVALPLARPALAVTALFSFLTAWNEFILAATFINEPTSTTLPVALQRYVGDYSTEWGHFAAGAIVVSLPVMALFFALEKYLVGGLTAGGVKG